MLNCTLSGACRVVAASAIISVPAFASADQIALSFSDSEIQIVGEFAGFQKNAYVVTTTMGPLHVPAKYVTCEGNDCLVVVNIASSASN